MIHQLFSTDHQRLDLLFALYKQHQDSRRELALRLFDKFSFGLEKHIEQEENLLFPEYEKATGYTDKGPTMVMRQEHKMIKQLLQRVRNGLQHNEDVSLLDAELASLLHEHNQKEERMLYVQCQSVIDQGAMAELLLKL
ncbi:MAG: hemerythrin domain-containing protein [Aestuariibacter sp.]